MLLNLSWWILFLYHCHINFHTSTANTYTTHYYSINHVTNHHLIVVITDLINDLWRMWDVPYDYVVRSSTTFIYKNVAHPCVVFCLNPLGGAPKPKYGFWSNMDTFLGKFYTFFTAKDVHCTLYIHGQIT